MEEDTIPNKIKQFWTNFGEILEKKFQQGKITLENLVKNEAEEWDKLGFRYQIARQWKEAGEAYNSAGQQYMRDNDEKNAVLSFSNAAKCYSQVDPNPTDPQGTSNPITLTLVVLVQVVKLYRNQHKLLNCAEAQTRVGELYGSQGNHLGAYEAFLNSGKLFEQEGLCQKAHLCYVKAAEIASFFLDLYEEAAELFEEAANVSNGDNLLKPSASENLLRAVLCYICSDGFDLPPVKAKVDMYTIDVPDFSESQAKFLRKIVQACEKNSSVLFYGACVHVSLDLWKLKMLKRICEKYSLNDVEWNSIGLTMGGNFEEKEKTSFC